MKVCFILSAKGIEPGPKFDHIMERIRCHVLLGHHVTVMRADEKPQGAPLDRNQFWVDEAQHIPVDAFK
jgi:hypothetical protein